MRDWLQDKQFLDLDGMLTIKFFESPAVEVIDVIEEEEMTYSRSVLGSTVEDVSSQRILGTLWNYHKNNLVFYLTKNCLFSKKSRTFKEKEVRSVRPQNFVIYLV